jgi:hypothetical protein
VDGRVQGFETRGDGSVEFAEDEGAAVAEQDFAGGEPVGAVD